MTGRPICCLVDKFISVRIFRYRRVDTEASVAESLHVIETVPNAQRNTMPSGAFPVAAYKELLYLRYVLTILHHT